MNKWYKVIMIAAVSILLVLLLRKKLFAAASEDLGALSYLGFSELPRGIRNNNPGNLVKSNIQWQQKVPHDQNTDGHFEQFNTYVYGIRAMIKDVKNDIEQDGLDTIAKIVYEYAPPTENHTETYISFLEAETGISAHQTISANQSTMRKLIKAIALYENGQSAVSDSEFNYAWQLI